MPSILIIKHGSLGDWIIATGAYKRIRQKHPDAHITFLTQSLFIALAKKTTWFNEIWEDNRLSFFSIATLRILRKLRQAQFDIVYDIQCSNRTKWYKRVVKAKNTVWHARTPDSEVNYNGLPTPHILKRIACRLSAAGIADFPYPDISWLKANITHFKLPKKYIVLMPGCAKKHVEKRWKSQGYIDFIKAQFEKNIICLLIGTHQDKEIIDAIYLNSRQYNAINLINQCSLAMIAELCRNALGALGSDTGPMHIAGLCCTCLVLFSKASDPIKNKPCGERIHTVQVNDLKTLTADTVIDQFNRILETQCAF